jgi:hypothetical protein
MNKLLTAYWIEFGPLLASQFGVTAYSFDDAISILKQKVYRNEEMPPVKTSIENIKFKDLDQNHVVPNMGAITERGIWYPLNYQFLL